jgi:hypothetical protein
VQALGFAMIFDTLVQGNREGGLRVYQGFVLCSRSTIKENLDPGGLVTTNVSVNDGSVFMSDSSMTATAQGLEVLGGGSASLTNTSVGATSWAILLTDARATLGGGTVDGPFRVDASRLTFKGVTQTAGGSSNQVLNDGFVRLEKQSGTITSVPRTTRFEGFSNGVVVGGTSLGHLTCASGADVWCEAGVTMSSSSCRLCPRP